MSIEEKRNLKRRDEESSEDEFGLKDDADLLQIDVQLDDNQDGDSDDFFGDSDDDNEKT